jgi:integrase
MNLTDRSIAGAKCRDGERTDYPDHIVTGLALRVTPTGAKSWSLRYRRKSDGKRQRMTIGSYPAYSLAEARKEAKQLVAAVARGEDPAKAAKRPNDGKPRTFGQLAKRYLEDYAAQKRSGKEDESMLRNDVLPSLEGEPLELIEAADITAILDAIIKRGAPVRANRTFATIRQVFNWGLDRGYIKMTPILRMKMPAKEESRERVLSPNEIRAFWVRVSSRTAMDWEMRTLLKLCLVTGQRISEVAGITRSELRLDKAEWHIPRERSKNGLYNIVPLSTLAMRLVKKALARIDDEDEYLLASRLTGKPYVKSSPSHAIRREASILFAPLRDKSKKVFQETATPHDLRRTLASGLGELRIPRLIQDKVLNHVEGKNNISAIYDRYEYLTEKREALDAWAVHLGEIIYHRT